MNLCHGKMLNQMKNSASRGNKSRIPQKKKKAIQAKKSNTNTGIQNPSVLLQVLGRNFFVPLRTQMEFEGRKEDPDSSNGGKQQ
jgi:hypothetical protein